MPRTVDPPTDSPEAPAAPAPRCHHPRLPWPPPGLEPAIATVTAETTIAATPAQVWDALRDTANVHTRLLPGYVLDTRIDGDTRYLTMPTGNIIRELIITVDDETRRLAYSAIEGFQLPLTHHHASFQVLDTPTGQARLLWITDVLPHPAATEARLRIDRGLQVMRETIERATTS
ncbi:SRPBCC family protein [Nocardia yamanashiensis]|uniref:SRPBCC family protein n=1 Tax=Nocardia yamanashiensis TaxID=209247 RepID=UPI000A76C014|nr:SRPBCC family protein [Nocardia yamanashiensis]